MNIDTWKPDDYHMSLIMANDPSVSDKELAAYEDCMFAKYHGFCPVCGNAGINADESACSGCGGSGTYADYVLRLGKRKPADGTADEQGGV